MSLDADGGACPAVELASVAFPMGEACVKPVSRAGELAHDAGTCELARLSAPHHCELLPLFVVPWLLEIKFVKW